MLDAAKKLNVTLLRWPGGNFSSNYHWKDGIGPRDKRPPRLEMAWGTVEEQSLRHARVPAILRRCSAPSPTSARISAPARGTEAQQWVEYCNSSEDTAMTRLRKQNGRARAVEGEVLGTRQRDGRPWQMGHRSAEDYGKFALEAAKLMKWTDPNIKLIAAGSSNFGAGVGLDRLEPHGARVSEAPCRLSVAPHCTSAIRDNDYGEFLASSLELDERIKTAEGDHRRARSPASRATARSISPGMSGTSGIARAATQQRGRRILEERYNLEDALVVATFLNSFVQSRAHREDRQHGATGERDRADLHERQAACSCRPSITRWQLFANNTKGKALELFVDSPKYKSRDFDEVPYLDVSAALR